MALTQRLLLTTLQNRCCAATSQLTMTVNMSSQKLKMKSSPPQNIVNDWIGPPDSVSNLRPTEFYIPDNETLLQKDYRKQREVIHQWNQQFWMKHNISFVEEKEVFIKQKLEELKASNPDSPPTKLTPEQLSVFYKSFCDENEALHAQYNREWYRRNVGLLFMAFKVKMEKVFRRQPSKES